MMTLFTSSLMSSPVSAHPLDISTTSFTLEGNTIQAVTYFHPSQVEAIIGATGISMRSLTYGDYYKYSGALEQYLRKKVILRDSK